MEDNHKWKKITNIKREISQIFPKFGTKAYMTIANFTNVSKEDNLQWKNAKSEIS
jgi:hypothetical protein